MKQRLNNWTYRLLGKDPQAVVVTFFTGDPELCRRMTGEVKRLVPDGRHFVATPHRTGPRCAANRGIIASAWPGAVNQGGEMHSAARPVSS